MRHGDGEVPERPGFVLAEPFRDLQQQRRRGVLGVPWSTVLKGELRMLTKRNVALAVHFAIALGLAACGKRDTSTPTAPTASQTATTLTISAPASTFILLGQSIALTAMATFTDGSSRTIEPSWSSDNAAALEVSTAGRVQAIGAGVGVITARFQDRVASLSLRALPDYSGTWSVQWRTTTCDAPPRWGAGFCNISGLLVGRLVLARAEADRLVGTWDNGVSWSGTVSGAVSVDGVLSVTGRISSPRGAFTFHSDLLDWRSSLSQSLGMAGAYREILSRTDDSGQALVVNEIVRASR